jgi:aminoglycoside phosphotransferase (APT) family kinase protein
MTELTPDNVVDFLRCRGWIGPGEARARPLTGGVSNVVLRVDTPEKSLVVKQSLPQLRTRDDWFSDRERVYRELEVMRLLGPLLPPLAVPEVLFEDRGNYVFAMAHAPEPFVVWKAALLEGRVSQGLAELAGRLLGRTHRATAGRDDLRERLGGRTVFIQLRVDPFYRRVSERRPEVADLVIPVLERLLTVSEAVCHGDFTPKNLLVHSAGFTLVDYETAHYGDPTMDLGLFLAHLLLKAVKHGGGPFPDATRSFWRGYGAEAPFRPLPEMQARAVAHCGVCLLARIDGTSPVEYLTEEPKREAVRRLGRSLLRDRPASWEGVLERLPTELAHLHLEVAR